MDSTTTPIGSTTTGIHGVAALPGASSHILGITPGATVMEAGGFISDVYIICTNAADMPKYVRNDVKSSLCRCQQMLVILSHDRHLGQV